MYRRPRTLMALCAIGVTAAVTPAFCADSRALHVTVPFAFTAGTVSLPAGEYTILEGDAHTVMIRSPHGSAILLSIFGEGGEADRNALSFRHTDQGYFLRAVYAAGRPSNLFRVAPPEEQ
jgi:hypothetical protein